MRFKRRCAHTPSTNEIESGNGTDRQTDGGIAASRYATYTIDPTREKAQLVKYINKSSRNNRCPREKRTETYAGGVGAPV